MLKLSCPCGAVRVAIDEAPDYLHDCNCALCSQAQAWWGYFHPSEMRVIGATDSWCRQDKPEPGARVHTCARCATTTHFVLTPAVIAKVGDAMMGVNMRLAAPRDLAGVELRYPDGRGWSGEGAFGYVRAARRLDGTHAADRTHV